jgi:L-galactono-1,4-lactone dehydrogenase
VWEVCFPTGTRDRTDGTDAAFVLELLDEIERGGVPAPAPIEQRWTASSRSLMSPAHGPPDGLHCWVGIISYLPLQDERQRREVTEMFQNRYCDILRRVGSKYGAASHWAKLERPPTVYGLVDLRLALAERYPLDRFNGLRSVRDPRNVLGSPALDLLVGKPPAT